MEIVARGVGIWQQTLRAIDWGGGAQQLVLKAHCLVCAKGSERICEIGLITRHSFKQAVYQGEIVILHRTQPDFGAEGSQPVFPNNPGHRMHDGGGLFDRRILVVHLLNQRRRQLCQIPDRNVGLV